ncbi:hypothetical protein [Dinoroseobacter sp. S375]|uniref:hypothetical protein n=1 Tax=Dinoroseobacter sp. S375 TaxID=3415136 RepID=UPI003C7E928C
MSAIWRVYMQPAPRALILSTNAVEAQDLAEMLDTFFGMTSAVCRSLDAAHDIARTHLATLEVAFVAASLRAADQGNLVAKLKAAQSKVVLIDADPGLADMLGFNALLRPFLAEDVRAALED